MKALVRTFFAMLFICVVSTQVVSAQEKGPWNRPSNSTLTGDEVDQANPNDSPGPYTEDDMLIELMLIMLDFGVDEEGALDILLSDVFGGSVDDGLRGSLL